MKQIFIITILLSFAAFADDSSRANECSSLINASKVNSFMSVTSNGSADLEKFNKQLAETFDQFSKIKPKLTKKQVKIHETHRIKIQSISEDNVSGMKIGFKHPSGKKIHAMTFYNQDVEDTITQTEDELIASEIFSEKNDVLQYVILEFDLDNDQKKEEFTRCNCYTVCDKEPGDGFRIRPLSCSHSKQKLSDQPKLPAGWPTKTN